MYSEKAKKHADACRFCYMCRHLCPVELVTGKETNTPRAKGLQVSMMERGMKMDAGSAKTMYECLLCGACTADCVTGFEPPIFIREARTQAALEGLTPAFAQKVIDKLEETGNAYGAKEAKVDFTGIPQQGETLVWLGSAARYAVPEEAEALFAILKKAGVAFAALADEPASGCELGDMIGHVEDVRIQAKKAAEAVKAAGAKQLIVLDSHDAAFFSHECRDWGVELPEIVTATACVAALVAEGKIVPEKKAEVVSYHDAERLSRDLSELLPARDVIRAMGCDLHELYLNELDNKSTTHKSCGSAVRARSCGTTLMGQMRPDLAVLLCRARWNDLKRTDSKILVASDPQALEALKLEVPEGCEVRDLFVMLAERI